MSIIATDKSHVGMGFYVDPITGEKHGEVVLLDKHLRNTLDRDNFMGWELTPKHQQMFNEGYIALVGIDPTKTDPGATSITPASAHRTGMYAHLRRPVFEAMFNRPGDIPMVFVDHEVLLQLEQQTQILDGDQAPQ